MPLLLVFVMGHEDRRGARNLPWWAAGAPCVGTARYYSLRAFVARSSSGLSSLFSLPFFFSFSPDGSDTLMGTYTRPTFEYGEKERERESARAREQASIGII